MTDTRYPTTELKDNMNDPTTESWRPVVGYEGYYEVSDLGRVRSLDRYVPHGYTGGQTVRGKVLKPTRASVRSSHLAVDLSSGGRPERVRRLVHRLVLEAFVGPCPTGMVACHSNDHGDDNRLGNLRWDTPAANEADKVRNGRNHYASRKSCSSGHEYAAGNLRVGEGGQRRRCRECERQRRSRNADYNREYKRNWRAARRAEGRSAP